MTLSPSTQGKVRDIHDLGGHLVLVATDRISAFDFVLPSEIPGKGKVLTQMTKSWLEGPLADIVPNHMVSTNLLNLPSEFVMDKTDEELEWLEGRFMLVKKAEVLPVECIVRGYITGSGWKSYQKDGTVCGIELPQGLRECDRLPEPIFTPSTKAEQGDHDENIAVSKMYRILVDEYGEDDGVAYGHEIVRSSQALYEVAADYALERGIIIPDTKFEFGLIDGKVTLIDEVLTPDSSRFWPLDGYEPGHDQPSFDKQFVRNWLDSQRQPDGSWNGEAPVPELPDHIIAGTVSRYFEALEMLTGKPYPELVAS